MRLLIFILALMSAFFTFDLLANTALPDDYKSPKFDVQWHADAQMKTHSGSASGDGELEAKNLACNIAASAYLPSIYNKNTETTRSSYISSSCECSTTSNSCNVRVSFSSSTKYFNGNELVWSAPETINSYSPDKAQASAEQIESYSCPPDNAPLYTDSFPTPDTEAGFVCIKPIDNQEPDLDPDCPAPTDNDPFVFGTGQQQTVCFDNPDGSQCSIQSDENGGYYIPISYNSQEPVACTEVDPTDPTEPDPAEPDPTDPDKTPDPDPSPEPDPTDNTDAPDILPALNQINDNLHTINNNMNSGFQNNHDRLDRVAKEIQISNELANEHVYESKAIKDAIIGANEQTLSILNDMKNGVDSIGTTATETKALITEGNGKLDKISDGINSTFEEGTCIGDLCSSNISKELDDFDASFQDFVDDKKDQEVPREFQSYLNRFDSYVSTAFSGFTGQCVPFDIRVSIRNVERVISVGEHCPYYEDYFKPVIEWFLYVLTFVSVLNITSQSFRAFSTV